VSKLRYLQVPLVVGLFALLAYRLDLRAVGAAVKDADAGVIALVVLLNVPLCALFGLRMNLVLLRLGHRLEPDLVLASAVVGNVAGALTPASTGEVLRAAALRSHSNVPVDEVVALIAFERGMSVYLLALGTLGAFLATALPAPQAVVACAACASLLSLPFVLAPLLDRLPRARSGVLGRILEYLRPMASQLKMLLRSPRLLAPWMVVAAATFGLFTLQYWLLARSVEDVASPGEVWIAFGASQLAAIVTLIPLGLGAADASLAGILHRFGLSLESGASVAVLVRATSTLPLLLLAVVSYLYLARRTRLAEVRIPDNPQRTTSLSK